MFKYFNHDNGINIGSLNLNYLLFSDDLVIFSESKSGLQKHVNFVDSGRWLQINWKPKRVFLTRNFVWITPVHLFCLERNLSKNATNITTWDCFFDTG